MKHLCYGTFGKVLLLCGLAKQKELHEALLTPIVGEYHSLIIDETRASKLFNCSAEIPKTERAALRNISDDEFTEISKKLTTVMIAQIRGTMVSSAVAAIWDLICRDEKILDNVVVDYIGKTTKNYLKQSGVSNDIDFLVGAFIFTFIETNNRIKEKEERKAIVNEISISFIEQAYEKYVASNIKKAAEAANRLDNTVNPSFSKPALNSRLSDRAAHDVNTYQRLISERNSLLEDINEMSPNSPRIPIKKEQLGVIQHEIAEYEQATLETTRLILDAPARTELDNRAHELILSGKRKKEGNTVAEAERATPTILLTAGVYNGVDAFEKRVNANLGDEIPVQISFKNISGFRMGSVTGNVILPDALEFVQGSTIIYNHTHPDGISNEDGITTEYINLGGYNNYDGKGHGSGSVSFRVKVSQDSDLFVNGVNTLNIVCHVCGYGKGLPSANTCVAYTAIDVKL